jgi:hypothetical protein
VIIREAQIVQEQLAHLQVRSSVDPGFGQEECATIRNRIQALVGAVDISFDVVERIERTERGTFRAVTSTVRRT